MNRPQNDISLNSTSFPSTAELLNPRAIIYDCDSTVATQCERLRQHIGDGGQARHYYSTSVKLFSTEAFIINLGNLCRKSDRGRWEMEHVHYCETVVQRSFLAPSGTVGCVAIQRVAVVRHTRRTANFSRQTSCSSIQIASTRALPAGRHSMAPVEVRLTRLESCSQVVVNFDCTCSHASKQAKTGTWPFRGSEKKSDNFTVEVTTRCFSKCRGGVGPAMENCGIFIQVWAGEHQSPARRSYGNLLHCSLAA